MEELNCKSQRKMHEYLSSSTAEYPLLEENICYHLRIVCADIIKFYHSFVTLLTLLDNENTKPIGEFQEIHYLIEASRIYVEQDRNNISNIQKIHDLTTSLALQKASTVAMFYASIKDHLIQRSLLMQTHEDTIGKRGWLNIKRSIEKMVKEDLHDIIMTMLEQIPGMRKQYRTIFEQVRDDFKHMVEFLKSNKLPCEAENRLCEMFNKLLTLMAQEYSKLYRVLN